MKNKVLIGLFLCLFLLVGLFVLDFDYKVITNNVESIVYETNGTSLDLEVGVYNSNDGHTITVNGDGTVLYDSTYSLTVTTSSNGYTLTGKIGTNNKAVTFYQINDTTLVSGGVVNYTHNSVSTYLYDYTVFKFNKVTATLDGTIELWSNGSKKGSYNNLQAVVDLANAGDTIKFTDDYKVTSGAYINKDLIIEGEGHTLDRSNWANAVFVIENGVNVTINNLTIDGGATNFEIDYSLSYPAVKEGTLTNDPKSNISAIISKGNIVANSLNLNNHYTLSSGSGISVVTGSATFKNCIFDHNYGNSYGAAINIGSNFKVGQTTHSVKDVIFEKCNFTNNYTIKGNGGAVFVVNTETIKFNDCNFYHNMAAGYTAGGGAILFYRTGVSPAEKNNIPYTQAYFDNCEFKENYSGNDGYAIQNESAELYITNSKFIGNEGLSSSSSVGTVSCMLDGNRVYKVVIKKCLFEKNKMGASVFGDHGTLVDLEMTDVTIRENAGSMSILLYSANAKFNNVTFENEEVSTTVLDVRPYVSETKYPLYKPQTVILENVNFKNTVGPTDILVRRRNHDMTLNTATLILQGNTNGNVHIWDDTFLKLEGNHNGNIYSDGVTPVENIVIDDEAKLDGKYDSKYGSYLVTLIYPIEEKWSTTTRQYLYLNSGVTYNDKQLFAMHSLSREDAKLVYYTDSNYTTLWNYTASANTTLYAKWEEHTHVYNGNLVVVDNVIYDQCDCGHLGKKISLISPKNPHYTGKEIGIVINDELKLDGYTIKYQVLDKNGNYVDIEGVPVKVGDYKAIFTYNDLVIEQEYSILEEVVNPSTGLSNPYLILGLILISSLIFIKFSEKKKYL